MKHIFLHTWISMNSPSCSSVCRPCCPTLVWSTFPAAALLSFITRIKVRHRSSRSSVFRLSMLQTMMLTSTSRLPEILLHLSCNPTWDRVAETAWIHVRYVSIIVWMSGKYLVYCNIRAPNLKGVFWSFGCGLQPCVRFLHLSAVQACRTACKRKINDLD